jgi:hypothetical protein
LEIFLPDEVPELFFVLLRRAGFVVFARSEQTEDEGLGAKLHISESERFGARALFLRAQRFASLTRRRRFGRRGGVIERSTHDAPTTSASRRGRVRGTVRV